ncbi:MAG: hypothetical protein M3Y71_20015 [Actinomycetota bacterium]|nr:hypothetical protein [Actinomycetota bacterium]
MSTPILRFDDEDGYADFATFVGRARALDTDGAMRLQVVGVTLAAHVQAIPGRGLLAEGGVTAVRACRLAEPLELDVVVPLSALTDRLARHPAGVELPVPPTVVSAPWASLLAPRAGWEPVGQVAEDDLRSAASAGIEEVTLGSRTEGGGAAGGAPALTALRYAVWSRPTPTTPPVPSGAAFAAHVLGFLARPGAGATARVLQQGRWVRVAASYGHVLVR